MEELDLVFEPFPSDSLGRFLFENIANFNIGRTGIDSWHPVGYFLKNRRGEWLAGLTGYVWGGWLHVNQLWVTQSLRGQRHGSRLMDAAEAFAAEHGCHGVTLETHSFQAPGFYAKRGYKVFGTLDDYPPGHSKLFLHKRLRTEASGTPASVARRASPRQAALRDNADAQLPNTDGSVLS